MIAKVKKNCTLSPDYTILVLDSFTAQLFSRLKVNFYELYRYNIYQVEDIKKQRKRYPMSDAIYFVEPSRKSIERVVADFPTQDQFGYDQYGQTHIILTGSCPEHLLESISMCEKLMQKTMSFLEANIDFNVVMDNVFTVSASLSSDQLNSSE